jgi:Fibronectin type III domain
MIKNRFKYLQRDILILIFVVVVSYSPAFAGSASLSWDPPITNEDGTPLTDLSGYKIYYGTTSAFYTQNIDAGNVVTFTVTYLTAGLTYYFAVTAYDSSLNESDYSNEDLVPFCS